MCFMSKRALQVQRVFSKQGAQWIERKAGLLCKVVACMLRIVNM